MEGTTPEGWFMASKAAGVELGQRRLNGTQTTGRDPRQIQDLGAEIINLHTIHTLRADRRHVPWFCSVDTRTSPRSWRTGCIASVR
jgi:hypothetical protein